jgi:hypothetical protein
VQRISHVTLRNITGTFGSFGTLHGNPGDTISDITLENIDVKLTGDVVFRVGKTDHLVFDNVRVNGADYAAPAAAP